MIQTRYEFGDDLYSQVRWGDATLPPPGEGEGGGEGEVSYFLYDGLGSTRSLTNASGAIVQSYNYRPFGEGINLPGELSTNHLFTGEYYDSNLDYYYLRARYYSPGLGRFTGYDPVEDANNRLHKYAYCGGNPLCRLDVKGSQFTDIGIATITLTIAGTVSAITVNSTPSRNIMNSLVNAALERPENRDHQLLAAIVFAESTSSGFSKYEHQRERILIGLTILNRTFYAVYRGTGRGNANREFGDGSIYEAIKYPGQFAGYGSRQWNKIMDGNDKMKMKSELDSLLIAEKLKLVDCIDDIGRLLALKGFAYDLPHGLAFQSAGEIRYPVAFNQAENDPPGGHGDEMRMEKIGKSCRHTFYGFLPGRERY